MRLASSRGSRRTSIRACLDLIPNNKVDWNFWDRSTGMRIYASCNGADFGLEEWQRWSNAQPQGSDNCEDRWKAYHTSPPTWTGAGALIKQARDALGGPDGFRPVRQQAFRSYQ